MYAQMCTVLLAARYSESLCLRLACVPEELLA